MTKPAYLNKPAQYVILYQGKSIAYTGYIDSLSAAKKFALARYGDKVQISCSYPDAFCDNVVYEVK
jgi:hypothetical protein